MKTSLIILAVFCILGSLVWLIIDPGMEPMISTISFIAALIGLNSSAKSNNTFIKQKGGKKSTNYQSQGDMTINN